MSYKFYCPACGAELEASPSIKGRKVRCPGCDELVEAREEMTREQRQLAETWSKPGAETTPELAEAGEAATFDPYYRWLAIPKSEQPPNHYRLLGVVLYEDDPDVITESAHRQMAHVKAHSVGKHSALSQRLLQELVSARIVLADEDRKAEYDRQLRARLAGDQEPKPARAPTEDIGFADEPDESPAPAAPRHVGLETIAGYQLPQQDEPPPQDSTSPPPAAAKQRAPRKKSHNRKVSAPPVQQPTSPPVAAPPVAKETAHQGAEEDDDDDDAIRLSDGSSEPAEMDMTPMVDVTFLLLIFFMLTAAFALQKAIEVPTPEQQEASTNVQSIIDYEENPDYVIVKVDRYNTFRVITAEWDEEAPSKQELLIKLREARRGVAGHIPSHMLVVANGEAQHQKVVDAVSAGSAVEMESVQLVSIEDDEEY